MKLVVGHRDRLVREALRRSLAKTRFELVAQCADIASLEKECAKRTAQLVLVELQLLGGKAERLPALLQCGAPVIALASTHAVAGAYEAMGHGALGLIEPPAIDESGALSGAQRLVSRMERLVGMVAEAPRTVPAPNVTRAARHPIVAIGASTGGPLALAKVLADLPLEFPAAVVIVQHIEGEFSDGLAEWLGGQCRLPVELARRGDSPKPGRVYVAGPGGHLVLSAAGQFGVRSARPDELHAPSIDALFLSLAEQADPGAAVILTGMGSDGAAGMGALHRRGWLTLAQDEASSVVFGMPRAALEAGAASRALGLQAIASALMRHFGKRVVQARSR